MNELTITLVTILFPGVLVAIIYDNYTEHKPWDSFKYILYSILFGVTSYAALQIIIFLLQFLHGIGDTKSIEWKTLSTWGVISNTKTEINPLEIIEAGLISIIIGFFFVWVTNNGRIHQFLVKAGISKKYGDESVYIKTIELTSGCYVNVYDFEKNLTYQGMVALYHENDKLQEITLHNVKIYKTEDSELLFESDLLYIPAQFGKILISKPKVE